MNLGSSVLMCPCDLQKAVEYSFDTRVSGKLVIIYTHYIINGCHSHYFYHIKCLDTVLGTKVCWRGRWVFGLHFHQGLGIVEI